MARALATACCCVRRDFNCRLVLCLPSSYLVQENGADAARAPRRKCHSCGCASARVDARRPLLLCPRAARAALAAALALSRGHRRARRRGQSDAAAVDAAAAAAAV
eukprot:5395342-Pleurochrysis_carterae.AAC.1